MSRLNWRLAIVAELGAPSAPRVINASKLEEIICRHRPHIADSTLRALIKDLVEMSMILPIVEPIYLNLSCKPEVTLAEAARHLRTGAVVSCETVLSAAGVLQPSDSKVSCIVPDSSLVALDCETLYLKPAWMEFRVIPQAFFAPGPLSQSDILDETKPYPCTTPEKALLDSLFIQQNCRSILPRREEYDLSKLNLPRLFDLARVFRLRHLLEKFLTMPSDEALDGGAI